jgi:predicted pyridoxine 5'-phosphate oxidase superfamily flavin-nucleotide-binding protein
MLPGKGELRRIELGEDAAAGVEIVTAGLGERQTPRSAGHEAHPDLLLEGGEVATGGCQRHAEAPGGGRQRAGLVARFIPSMRSFYLATASKDGQPYIQHRDGPPGFLHVIDDRTLAFADFSGNRQYISTGNLAENPRSILFLMDYEHRQRVKIWGTARVVEDDPELIAKLFPEGYKARAEAAIVFTVEAWDANCPQHIPQMMFAEDVAGAIGVLQERIAALEAENARLRAGRGLEP